MSSTSTFTRWKKADLIDLANKLEIDGFPNYAKKSDMIEFLEAHLNRLESPVDFKDDYPELRSFYESIIVDQSNDEGGVSGSLSGSSDTAANDSDLEKAYIKDDDDGSQSADEASAKQPGADASAKANFNLLDFSADRDSSVSALTKFKFDFQDYVSDIKCHAQKLNENVQDCLSTISSVDAIFSLVECSLLVRDLLAAGGPPSPPPPPLPLLFARLVVRGRSSQPRQPRATAAHPRLLPAHTHMAALLQRHPDAGVVLHQLHPVRPGHRVGSDDVQPFEVLDLSGNLQNL